jgi:hypothetical protein
MQISREIFPYIFNPNDGKDIGKFLKCHSDLTGKNSFMFDAI